MIDTATIITLVGPVVALLALDLVVRLIRRSRRPDRQRLAEQAREVAIRLAAEEQERAETAAQEQARRIA